MKLFSRAFVILKYHSKTVSARNGRTTVDP